MLKFVAFNGLLVQPV